MLLWIVVAPAVLDAQEPAAIVEARRLRDAGEFAGAASALRPYLAEYPDDAGVQWLMGQLLHRAGWIDEAQAHYAAALRLTPDEPWLRLEFAELQVAQGDWSAAVESLRSLTEDEAPASARAGAHALLGTLAYWRGDLAEALRRSRLALEVDPGHARAHELLVEVRALMQPWTRLQAKMLDDNQPYRQSGATLEGGLHLSPLWTISGGVSPGRRGAESVVGSVDAWLGTGGFVPGPQVEWEVRAGGVWSDAVGTDAPVWTGAASLARRLPANMALRVSAGRSPYRATATSLDTLLLVESAEMRLDRASASGWDGEAVLRGERFPDGNTIRTAYAWVLAPLLPSLRLGYAFAWQDATETTWAPLPGSRSSGADALSGHYAPYYTPEQMRSHSILGELAGSLGGATLTLSGALGVHAREDAPVLGPVDKGTPPQGPKGWSPRGSSGTSGLQVAFFPREFTPWRAAAALNVPVGRALTLRTEAEREHTAFYASTRVTVGAVYRVGAP